jgi:Uma2 family endonuclease
VNPRPRTRSPQPVLHNGDRMTQEAFHRCYEAYPDDVKIELIGGLVYWASPVPWPHGRTTAALIASLAYYEGDTPGLEGAANVTLLLGEWAEPQPDGILRLLPEFGGQSSENADQYLTGAPELVVEVAYSTRSIDVHQKRKDYRDHGVREYVVACLEERQLHWFDFVSHRKLRADSSGVFRSRLSPGLWIDSTALFEDDVSRLHATIGNGIATPEHAEFVRALDARRQAHRP